MSLDQGGAILEVLLVTRLSLTRFIRSLNESSLLGEPWLLRLETNGVETLACIDLLALGKDIEREFSIPP